MKNNLKDFSSTAKREDGSYLDWKGWHDDTFGQLTKEHDIYFSSQLKRVQCPIKSEMRILEIGFGSGKFLAYATNQGAKVTGTEINEHLVYMGKRRGFDVHFTNNVSNFPQDHFDLVVAFDVLEHIPQEYLGEFIKRIRDILRPGGKFLSRFPNGDSPFGLINQNGDMTHITSIGSSKVRHLAEIGGMKVLFIEGEAEPILAVKGIFVLHRLFSIPIKFMLNIFINVVILGRRNIAFFSLNLVAVLKKV